MYKALGPYGIKFGLGLDAGNGPVVECNTHRGGKAGQFDRA